MLRGRNGAPADFQGVDPKDVWAQSFNKDDVLYWIQNEPKFGKQVVYLDSIDLRALGCPSWSMNAG